MNAESRSVRMRLRFLGLGFVILSVAYAGRLVQLQLVQADEWRAVAEDQQAARQEIPARRGMIVDRNGRALAEDGQEHIAYLAPRELEDFDAAVEAVGRLLALSPREERRLRTKDNGWVRIPRRLSNVERDRVEGAIRTGVHFETIRTRNYPEGPLGRGLLGAVGSEGRGATGLELEYDTLLVGTPGAVLTRVDGLGGTYRLPDAQLEAPEPGHDVELTIDARLQAIAEDALTRGLAETGASGGDILLLDPRTGEILALASRRGDGSDKVPAFTDPYEPGSTLKPFLLAAVRSERAAALDDTIDVERGVLHEGRRVVRDVHPYDLLTVAQVVQYSSNVGAAKLAKLLRPSVHYRYLRDFGFGLSTGVEHPSESAGLLRRPSSWSGLSQTSLAMGYEISVTSLQLAAAYGALANGGVLMKPYLVREIRDAEGRTVFRRDPQALRRVVDEGVAAEVSQVLASVVASGTGTGAALSRLAVAGKTGTARLTFDGRYEYRYASSFVGFTPADDPQLVVLTKLEDPQGKYYGGTVAAPIIQSMLQAALATRGIVLDRRLAVAASTPRRWTAPETMREEGPFIFAVGRDVEMWPAAAALEDARRPLPDLRGLPLRAAAARLHELGFRVEATGFGRVSAQQPDPGRAVARGATVILR